MTMLACGGKAALPPCGGGNRPKGVRSARSIWRRPPERMPSNSARLGLALPVIERAAVGPKHANAAEADRAYRIGDASVDFAGIGILDNLRPEHRRDTEIDERFGGRDVDHLMRVLGAGGQGNPVPRPHRDACIADPRLSGTGEDVDAFFVDVMGVAGERDAARRHFSQCRAEGNAAGGLAELSQAHVVPAFDHFADFDFVGVAYVWVSHRFSLLLKF